MPMCQAGKKSPIHTEGIFSHDSAYYLKVIDQLVAIDDIEKRSGLDFLRALPDDKENRLQSTTDRAWAEENFD